MITLNSNQATRRSVGIPISAFTTSAQFAEVHAIETLVEVRCIKVCPERLIYNQAADADWLRDAFERCGIEQITTHRSNYKPPRMQEGCSLSRYRHRWKIERTIMA